MVCLACSKRSKQNDSSDCFENALDTLRQHYLFYKNSVRKRDLELLQLKERNEELMKALDLLQNTQQQVKRFKTNVAGSWISPKNSESNPKEDVITDISSTDDEGAPGASNLNVALNSEQLFETSISSPAANVSNSERIISPRAKVSPRRNKQIENIRTLKERNKALGRSKSEWTAKERSSPSEKSWATKFVKPAAKAKVAESMIGIDKKPDKKVNLSLKKINPGKMKQSLLHFNNSKDSSLVETEVCEDIIDASPVVCKNSRAGRSWAQRTGPNLSCQSNTNLSSNEIRRSHEDTTSMPIEDIVFDFSPTKKSDNTTTLNSPTTKLSSKQLKFDQVANDSTTDCTALPSGQISTTPLDNSSVVILTPATQDIIFVDDSCAENSDMDTMDLLADIMKQDDTEQLEILKKYESKNIQMQQKPKQTAPKHPKEKNKNFLEAVTSIKKEKVTQRVIEEIHKTNETGMDITMAREPKHQNPLLANSAAEDEEEEEDPMPKPLLIKQEQKQKPCTTKKRTFRDRFNVDCDDCEKYVNFFGDTLSDRELAEHINKCIRHKQPDDMRQNTPENFWNPFILSFADNDPRNEVLIDTRSRDKPRKFGKY